MNSVTFYFFCSYWGGVVVMLLVTMNLCCNEMNNKHSKFEWLYYVALFPHDPILLWYYAPLPFAIFPLFKVRNHSKTIQMIKMRCDTFVHLLAPLNDFVHCIEIKECYEKNNLNLVTYVNWRKITLLSEEFLFSVLDSQLITKN